jgi:hypothetical protein
MPHGARFSIRSAELACAGERVTTSGNLLLRSSQTSARAPFLGTSRDLMLVVAAIRRALVTARDPATLGRLGRRERG